MREGVAGGVLGLERDFVVGVSALAESMHFFLNGVLNALEMGALLGEGGPVFAIAIRRFGDLRFDGGFLSAQGLEECEGILRVGSGVGIAAESGDDFGIAVFDGAPDGLAHDAA